MTPPPEFQTVALELAELRRPMEVEFTEQCGQLALLVQRGDQTDKTLDEHGKRLDSLERARWPLPTIGVLAGLVGAGTGLVALFPH